MTWTRPTLSALVTRIRGDFRTRLSPDGSIVRRAAADVLATVWAGAAHMMHGHIEYVAEQLFGVSASRFYLIILAAKYGLTIIPATFAAGTITVTGSGTVPEGTIFVRDDGDTYVSTAIASIAGSGAVSVQAQLAGSDGNMEASDELSFQTPVAGLNSGATVVLIEDGIDEEDLEVFRARYILRRQSTPRGGSDSDYELWAKSVAGVTRVWVDRHTNGLGTLTVWFVLDGESDIFPSAGKIAEVQAVVDARKPTTAEPTADGPTDLPIAFTIGLTNDTATIRTAIESELSDLFFRSNAPGDNVSVGTVLLSGIRTAIGNASDGDFTMTVPSADVVPGVGELATVGVVTWA